MSPEMRGDAVLVPGGATVVGNDHYYAEERPLREVTVGDLWFDRYPVTNAAFAAFVEETGHVTVAEIAPDPADFPGADPRSWCRARRSSPRPRARSGSTTGRSGGGGSPVRRGGRRRVPAAAGRTSPTIRSSTSAGRTPRRTPDGPTEDLPTEAEWEYAARGGLLGSDFAWGDELSPDGEILANTWRGPFPWRSDDPQGFDRTSPIGSYPANGYGLHDMIGNVWEWTRTRWSATHAGPADEVAPTPPCCGGSLRVEETDRMVTKGGSHLCSPDYCQRYRPAARQGHGVNDTTSHVGFRCVRRT